MNRLIARKINKTRALYSKSIIYYFNKVYIVDELSNILGFVSHTIHNFFSVPCTKFPHSFSHICIRNPTPPTQQTTQPRTATIAIWSTAKRPSCTSFEASVCQRQSGGFGAFGSNCKLTHNNVLQYTIERTEHNSTLHWLANNNQTNVVIRFWRSQPYIALICLANRI